MYFTIEQWCSIVLKIEVDSLSRSDDIVIQTLQHDHFIMLYNIGSFRGYCPIYIYIYILNVPM